MLGAPRGGPVSQFEVGGEGLPAQGYPRRLRLVSRNFLAVLRGGKQLRGKGLTVLLKANALLHPRFGVIVPKRLVPLAVDRNRVKRLLREWFRCNSRRVRGWDCIVRFSAVGTHHGRVRLASVIAELEQLLPTVDS